MTLKDDPLAGAVRALVDAAERIMAERDALRAEVARLTAERDEARADHIRVRDECFAMYACEGEVRAQRDRAVGLLRGTLNRSIWYHTPLCNWTILRSLDADECKCGTREHALAVSALLREVG